MKILSSFVVFVLSLTAIIMTILLSSSSVEANGVTPDDMKCQVCDVAVAYYVRTLLHANLFCRNRAFKNNTDGTQTKLSYVIKALEPFAVPGITADQVCAEGSPARTNPGQVQDGASAKARSASASSTGAGAAATKANNKATSGSGIGATTTTDDDDFDEAVEAEIAKSEAENDDSNLASEEPPFVIDQTAATELARKNFICQKFLDAFPAIEIFPAAEGAAGFDPDDPKTYTDKPEPVNREFIGIMKRACELATQNPRKNTLLVTAARKVVEKFNVRDGPRTVPGARNLIYKTALLPVQEEVCAASCPGDMKRLKNFKAIAAFSVDGKPIIQ